MKKEDISIGTWRPVEELMDLDNMEQVKCLFISKGWATYLRGMFTKRSDEFKGCLSEYVFGDDRFYDWDYNILPTHYLVVPDFKTIPEVV